MALRVARLAVALLDGAQQKTTAQELDVSPRTAKADAARIRAVLPPGGRAFRYQPEGEPPPVPWAPDDRVTLTTPGRRRRRTAAAF